MKLLAAAKAPISLSSLLKTHCLVSSTFSLTDNRNPGQEAEGHKEDYRLGQNLKWNRPPSPATSFSSLVSFRHAEEAIMIVMDRR